MTYDYFNPDSAISTGSAYPRVDDDGTQLQESMWCDKFAVVGALSLINAISYVSSVSIDEERSFMRMLKGFNKTHPVKDSAGELIQNDWQQHSAVGTILGGKDALIGAYSPRSVFALYLTNAFVAADDFLDRRTPEIKNGIIQIRL